MQIREAGCDDCTWAFLAWKEALLPSLQGWAPLATLRHLPGSMAG